MTGKTLKKASSAQKVSKTGAPKSLLAKKVAPAPEVKKGTRTDKDSPKKSDWEAVERDYRTGKFTLRELEKKHGPSYAEISRRSKREGWTKDLRDIIRHATNAAVLRETVTTAQQNVTDTVLAAAEASAKVILGHRSQVVEVRDAAAAAKEKLIALGDSVADIREASAFAGAVESLSRTYKNLQEMERKAFRLDDDLPPASELASLSDEDLDQRVEKMLERHRQG